MLRTLKHRLEQLETRSGIGEDMPRLFLTISDMSIPDPDNPSPTPPLGDEIGLFSGSGVGTLAVVRQPGESVDEMKERAAVLFPDCCVFMMAYANHSRDRFPLEAAAWEAAAAKQQAELAALEAAVYAKRADR